MSTKMFSSFYKYSRNKKRTEHQAEDGLTLIECLVAIAVIALTSASIAPVLVLSVATRVQNQKSEQALQLAQGEIDRVRLLVERNATYTSDELQLSPASTAALSTAISAVGPPTSSVNVSTWSASGYVPSSPFSAKQVNIDNDAAPEYLVQSFRGEAAMEGGMPVAFSMGVRVYDFNSVGANPTGLSTDSATLGFTSGEGQRGNRPLAVLYTQIINSDDDRSLCEYLEFLEASVPSSMSCN